MPGAKLEESLISELDDGCRAAMQMTADSLLLHMLAYLRKPDEPGVQDFVGEWLGPLASIVKAFYEVASRSMIPHFLCPRLRQRYPETVLLISLSLPLGHLALGC